MRLDAATAAAHGGSGFVVLGTIVVVTVACRGGDRPFGGLLLPPVIPCKSVLKLVEYAHDLGYWTETRVYLRHKTGHDDPNPFKVVFSVQQRLRVEWGILNAASTYASQVTPASLPNTVNGAPVRQVALPSDVFVLAQVRT